MEVKRIRGILYGRTGEQVDKRCGGWSLAPEEIWSMSWYLVANPVGEA